MVHELDGIETSKGPKNRRRFLRNKQEADHGKCQSWKQVQIFVPSEMERYQKV